MLAVETNASSNWMRMAALLLTIRLDNPGRETLFLQFDITTDKTGNLYIVDEKGHRVLKYSGDGEFLNAFGEYGDAAGQFIQPFQIAAFGRWDAPRC